MGYGLLLGIKYRANARITLAMKYMREGKRMEPKHDGETGVDFICRVTLGSADDVVELGSARAGFDLEERHLGNAEERMRSK